uniref:Transmembrane protein n=1 Tax=Globodera rostochiensis TaxID=31243 RepID=A0A914H2E5_GLORO
MESKNDHLSFLPNSRTSAICIFLFVSITSALSFGHPNATTAPQKIFPTNVSDQSNSPTPRRLPTAVRSEPNTNGTASTCNQTKTEGGGEGRKSIRWTTTFIQLVMIVLIVGICLFCALDSAMYGLIKYVRTWRPVGGGGGGLS